MTFDLKNINYLTEPMDDFVKGIDHAIDLQSLREVFDYWEPIANAARNISYAMGDDDFNEFRDGLKMERKNKFAGEHWQNKYSELIMPSVMFIVTMYATEFHATWGAVYIRMKQEGLITERDGIAYLVERK